MNIEKWRIKDIVGYEPITTFYDDFTIAEKFGINAIEDTFNRCFKEWNYDYKYMSELSLVLNWKIWRWHDNNYDFSMLYNDLWVKLDLWCRNNLKGKELEYFNKIID